MRPTSLQVEISLRALREQSVGEPACDDVTIDLTGSVGDDFVLDLVATLSSEAAMVRPDMVREATLLLDPRLQPSAEKVADMLVSRLVCDRLR